MLICAVLVLVVGSAYRLWRIVQLPVQRHIAITPTPKTRVGVMLHLLIESFFFRTLFCASFWTWLFGWLFHVCLLLTFVIHGRFLSIPAPKMSAWLMPYSSIISAGLLVGLLGLLIRRLFVNRVRYVSSVSDYLHLLLIIFIALAGVLMARSNSVNVYEVTVFVQSLMGGEFAPLSTHWVLAAHVVGASILLIVYPLSKLFHGPLMWFNPTRSQPSRTRS